MSSLSGFLISNINGAGKSFIQSISDCSDEIQNADYKIWRKTSHKFLSDKVFQEDEKYIFILEGVIQNRKELFGQYGASSMFLLCRKLYETIGENFHTAFIGNFAGAFYEKETDTWCIFANKYSSKATFYYMDNGFFAVAPRPIDICDLLKDAGLTYTFNKQAAYLLMTYGYMGTNDTFVNEIKKIEAGEYLRIVRGKGEVKSYHRFTNHAYDLSACSEEEIIEGIDQRFRAAIRREYEKDLETDCRGHLRSLTGGLDSRSAAFVSHALGYHNVINYTFGQPGCADEVIARQISIYLRNQMIFMSSSVENGDSSFLQRIDEAVFLNQGLIYYMNIASYLNRFCEIDPDCYGLRHEANLSESVLTTYMPDPSYTAPPSAPLHVDCDLVIDKVSREHLKKYENEDIYTLYSMFFNKYLVKDSLGDTSWAFPCLDTELVEYCLSIPKEIRKHYHIYYKWFFTKYPDAADFKLEKLNAKISDGGIKKWWGKVTRYGSPIQYLRCSKNPIPSKIRAVFQLDKRIQPSPVALFPFDYWYATDSDSRAYMEEYFQKNLSLDVIDDELRKDLQYIYENGQSRPKSMAITVLAAAKLFFT